MLASVSVGTHETPASDDDKGRRGRLLLLGRGAVLVHRLARRLAAELDEYEQQPARDAERDARCSFDERAFSPAGSSGLLGDEEKAYAGARGSCLASASV